MQSLNWLTQKKITKNAKGRTHMLEQSQATVPGVPAKKAKRGAHKEGDASMVTVLTKRKRSKKNGDKDFFTSDEPQTLPPT